jgi:carbon monoxide dehydrogenase subunit G
MEIRESFVVPTAVDTLWSFFEDVESVSACVPGLQSLTILGPDEYKVVVKQKVGYFSATFEITTRREEAEHGRYMQFASVGRTVRGAMGNLRSKDRVEFEVLEDGGTRVHVLCQPALGGVLGAVGHKVILSKSREMTEQFAAALCERLGGAAGTSDEAGSGGRAGGNAT